MKIYFNVNSKSFSVYEEDFEFEPNENEIAVKEEIYEEFQEKIMNCYFPIYNVVNNDLQITYELNISLLNNQLRFKRKSYLEAFDKWEKAVLRGREEENDSIMLWYYDLLDLKESAFENIPNRVNYYL